MIELRDVHFAYPGGSDVVAVNHLRLPPGLTLLLGPNGAGKSSLLRLIAGVERPREGRITVDGFDLWVQEVEARRGLAYVPEQPELTPYATIGEIARLVCRLRGVPEAVGHDAVERVGLAREARRSVRELSQGQRRRAVLACAFIGEPRTLILDEPLEAMDRTMRDEVIAWILDAAKADRTVVVASHEFEELAAAARVAAAVRAGAVALHELPSDPGERLALLEELARGR